MGGKTPTGRARWPIVLLVVFLQALVPGALPERAAGAPQATPSVVPVRAADLDAIFERVVAVHGLVGLQAAVATSAGLVYGGAFGQADLEAGAPVTMATLFPTASVGKAFTAATLLRLVQAGRIELDKPVSTYVPTYPFGDAITVRHLALHQSGIRHYRDGERGAEFFASHYDDVVDALDLFATDPPQGEPGAVYSYSSYGYNLLAAALQSAAGAPFGEVVRNEVIEPLGLEATRLDDVRRVIERRANLYIYSDPTRADAPREDDLYRVPSSWDYSYNAGGGNLLSTAADLARFGTAFFSEGFLGADALAMAQTPQSTASAAPTQWSFGWFAGPTERGRTMRINGAFAGVYADLRVFPDAGLSIAFITNTGSVGNLGYVTGAAGEYVLGPAADAGALIEGDLWYSFRRWSQAEAAYRQLVEQAPEDGRSWLRYGESLLFQGRLDESITAFERAGASAPFAPAAAFRRAAALAQSGDEAAALAAFRTALEAGFDNWVAIDNESRFESLRATAGFAELVQAYRREGRQLPTAPAR